MNENKEQIEQAFYDEVASLLNTTSNYRPQPYSYKTRWNNRSPGNGRFESWGLVRMFGGSNVHISLREPLGCNKWFKTPEEALDFLRTLTRTLEIR